MFKNNTLLNKKNVFIKITLLNMTRFLNKHKDNYNKYSYLLDVH